MRGAYPARTLHAGVMPHSNHDAAHVLVGNPEDSLEKISVVVLDIAPQGKAAQIGNLDHARQRAVDEHRRLDDVRDPRPEGAAPVEALHQQGMLVRRGFVVVVDQQAVILLTAVPVAGVLQLEFESRNQLLECLFVDRQRGTGADMVDLVNTLRE